MNCSMPGFPVSLSLLKIISIESVRLSNHLIFLCRPLLVLPSIFPSIRVFSNESALHIRWLKYWSFSISPSNEYSGLIFRMDWLDLLASKGLSRVFSNTTVQKRQLFGAQSSLWPNTHIYLYVTTGKTIAWLHRPFQYSDVSAFLCAAVHGVTKSQTQLSDSYF